MEQGMGLLSWVMPIARDDRSDRLSNLSWKRLTSLGTASSPFVGPFQSYIFQYASLPKNILGKLRNEREDLSV